MMEDNLQLELFPRFSKDDQDEAENQIISLQKIIDYEIREYPIEVLIQKHVEGEIFIPKYQRKYIWDQKRASKFIESLILGLPIPYMFLADSQGRSEIVDGSQRIRTLRYFLEGKFALLNLEKLSTIEGFRFQDLSQSRQKRFKKRTVRLIELTDKADWETRRDVFQRINTTPVNLTDMEKRMGILTDNFRDFISDCANNKKFKILCPMSKEREDRYEREELVLRYFAYSDKYLNFEHRVDEFVSEYAKEKEINFDAQVMANEFEDMLDFVDAYFPNGFKKGVNYLSTPRVRFEALSIGVSLALKESDNLNPSEPVENWLYSKEFEDHTTSDAANNRNKVIGRIEFVKNKLLGIK